MAQTTIGTEGVNFPSDTTGNRPGLSVTFTGSIAGTTLTVSSTPTGVGISPGMNLSGGTIPAGTYIVSNISGTGTSSSSTWNVSTTVTQSSTTITGSFPAPVAGTTRFNSTIRLLEYYDGTNWNPIDTPPGISSISGIINTDNNSTITVNGTYFKSGAVVTVTGAGVSNVARNLTTTYVSATQLTAATNASSVNYVATAAFGITVTNPSGLAASLASAGVIGSDPLFTTSAGSLGSITDRVSSSFTISATDATSGTSLSFAVTGGNLPPGMSMSSGGVISGTPNDVSSSITSTFTTTVTSSLDGITKSQSNSITVTPRADGTSSARANSSAAAIKSLTGTTTSGLYYITLNGSATGVWCDMTSGTAWMLAMRTQSGSGTFGYGSGYWTNGASGLNDTTAATSEADIKNGALWNYWGVNTVRLTASTSGSSYTNFPIQTSGFGGPSLNTIFSQGNNSYTGQVGNIGRGSPNGSGWMGWFYNLTGTSANYFDTQPYCNVMAVNVSYSSWAARMGISMNNENDCSSNDSALGIGFNSPSVGAGAHSWTPGANFANGYSWLWVN